MLHIYRGIPRMRPYESLVYVSARGETHWCFIYDHVQINYTAFWAPNLHARISGRVIFHKYEWFDEYDDIWQLYYRGPCIAWDVHYARRFYDNPLKNALNTNGFSTRTTHRDMCNTNQPINAMIHNYSKIFLTKATDL